MIASYTSTGLWIWKENEIEMKTTSTLKQFIFHSTPSKTKIPINQILSTNQYNM